MDKNAYQYPGSEEIGILIGIKKRCTFHIRIFIILKTITRENLIDLNLTISTFLL